MALRGNSDAHRSRPVRSASSSASTQIRLPGAQRRRVLMQSALECFAKKSYHDTSMEEIAAAAGVTKPVIYQHFHSKRQLYSDLLTEVGTRLCNAIRSATESSSSPYQRVERGYQAYFRFAWESRTAYELLFLSGLKMDPEFSGTLSAVEEEIATLVISRIEADIDDDHRRFLALGVIALAEGTARRWLASQNNPEGRELSYEESGAAIWAKRVTELAWAGLRGVQRDSHSTTS